MSGARAQKVDLLKWANDQNQLDRTAKSTLKELASYADADCCAWAKVATLAYGVNCSERTLQYHLRALQEAGLIRDSGRVHRLEGSTRSVPIYQLAPEEFGLGKSETMGAEIAPILGHGCKIDGAMGATGLHPQETIGDQEVADATSPGAGEREALFVKVIEACPRSVLKFSHRSTAFAAFGVLADQGVDVARLPDCLRRMAADPAFKTRKFPPPLETWLSEGQFEGWWTDEAAVSTAKPAAVAAAAPGDHAAPGGDQAVWDRALGHLRMIMTEGEFGSWLRPAYLGAFEGRLFVVALTGTARDWIKGRAWSRVLTAWRERGQDARPLTLVSKSEFAALVRQTEGVE